MGDAPPHWDCEAVCYDAQKTGTELVDPVWFTNRLEAGNALTDYGVRKILGADGEGHMREGGDQRIFWAPIGPNDETLPDPRTGKATMYEGTIGLAYARQLCEEAYRPGGTEMAPTLQPEERLAPITQALAGNEDGGHIRRTTRTSNRERVPRNAGRPHEVGGRCARSDRRDRRSEAEGRNRERRGRADKACLPTRRGVLPGNPGYGNRRSNSSHSHPMAPAKRKSSPTSLWLTGKVGMRPRK